MIKFKIKRISTYFVSKNYPDLYKSVEEIEGLSTTQKEHIYGLCVDITTKCFESPIELFNEDFVGEEETEELDYPRY